MSEVWVSVEGERGIGVVLLLSSTFNKYIYRGRGGSLVVPTTDDDLTFLFPFYKLEF